MRRAAVIALSLAVAGTVAPESAATPRPGKVVRVERPQHASKKRIRLCVQYLHTGGTMLCIGAPPPAVDQEIELFEFQGTTGPHAGVGRVLRTRRSTQTGCESDQVHEVDYSSNLAPSGMMLGIIGVDMNPNSQVKPDSSAAMPTRARDGESRWLGFDVDGEGEIDLLLTMRKCDLDRPPGHTGQAQCLSYWVRDSDQDDWRLHNEDAIYDCN